MIKDRYKLISQQNGIELWQVYAGKWIFLVLCKLQGWATFKETYEDAYRIFKEKIV